MTTKPTPFGELSGFTFRELASNSKMDGGFMTEYNELQSPLGNLVPQYEAEDMGRRSVKPICFYKDGSLKSLPLQSQTILQTPAGPMPAELVTFYRSGAIKRIFPLDGKLSGFWSWENEFKLAVEIAFFNIVRHLCHKNHCRPVLRKRRTEKALHCGPGKE